MNSRDGGPLINVFVIVGAFLAAIIQHVFIATPLNANVAFGNGLNAGVGATSESAFELHERVLGASALAPTIPHPPIQSAACISLLRTNVISSGCWGMSSIDSISSGGGM